MNETPQVNYELIAETGLLGTVLTQPPKTEPQEPEPKEDDHG